MKKTPFFVGAHDLILDPKNRISIPAPLRKHFDPADDGSLFLTLKDSVPWLYTLGHFRRLVRRHLSPGLMPDDLQRKFTYLTLSLGHEIEVDGQGRVVLPEMILDRAGLGKDKNNPNAGRDVTLVGVNDHLELHSRAHWTALREKLFAQAEVVEQWARSSMQAPIEQKTPSPIVGMSK